MPYRHATEREDYSDYASGRVFYGLPGQPAFPVRLASEIFQRCLAVRRSDGAKDPCVLYDPCCGGAYHLSTLAYLHWPAIAEIIGSDVDEEVLSVAERNLALLTAEGLERRMAEISGMLAAYGKPSHAAALQSAERLRDRLQKLVETHQVRTQLFCADAMDGQTLRDNLGRGRVDLVMADVPYGQRSSWRVSGPAGASSWGPMWQMLESLRPLLSSKAVVAVASDKRQKVAHGGYRRIERFRLGKRQVTLIKPLWAL